MARIVHCCTDGSFLPHIAATLRFLAARGHEVHLICHQTKHDCNLPAGVETHSIPFSRRVSPRVDALTLAKCLALLRRLEPDLVHAHNPKAGLIAMTSSSLIRVPRRVYHVHGLPYFSLSGAPRELFRATERIAATGAHRVLCVSSGVREALARDCGVAPSKTRLLANGSAQGVDTTYYRPDLVHSQSAQLRARLELASDDPLVIFVGRFHPEKGLALLARIWPQVVAAHPRAKLLLVGRPDEVRPFDVAGAFHRAPRVTILPYLTDPRPAYGAANLLVLPSLREGLPTTVLEAAAMEVPSLVSDTLGCRDAVVPGRTGRLVEMQNEEAWTTAIVNAFHDRARLESLGAEARAWVSEHFRPDATFAALETCYRELGVAPP